MLYNHYIIYCFACKKAVQNANFSDFGAVAHNHNIFYGGFSMKKLLAILMALALVVCCFAACGKTDDAKTDDAAASDFLVGAIYINSQNDTLCLNGLNKK